MLNENSQFIKLPDIPAWYNRIPVAYIQQILVKSNIHLIKNTTFYLSDSFRAPLLSLFELNEFIRNLKSSNGKSINDLCLHVGELKSKIDYLPEYNCLYISPASYWQNNEEHFKQDDNLIEKIANFKARELLFGINWKKITRQASSRVLQTYAITIAFKIYDKTYIDELKQALYDKFQINMTSFNDILSNQEKIFTHLQYSSRSLVYYIPYISLYIILFLYIYISVSKIEFVKSKWGLALAAVSQVVASLFMSLGICSFFGLTPTLNSGEVFPYLVIFIGFENIVVLTKSVVSTPFDLDVKYRIALGLQKEAWKITKNLTFELIIIFVGICTMVPAIQEFCAFAYIGLLIDFFMQMTFFVTVLSIDIRRMQLSDLNKKTVQADQALKSTRRSFKGIPNNSILVNKSVKFFYFWARTRLIQRALMFLSILWIILIFYKSLLVVELLRHDVNLSKDTIDALLPKSGANSLQNLFSIDSQIDFTSDTLNNTRMMTIFNNRLTNIDSIKHFGIDKHLIDTQNWKKLPYFHWLSLFESYNITLHNRFITILPQINLYQEISADTILKQRNEREIERLTKSLNFDFLSETTMKTTDTKLTSNLVTNAILELILILIFGFPAMVFLVYFIIIVYKCLCSQKYEQWRKKWSTQSIKRHYFSIHGIKPSNSDSELSDGDEDEYKQMRKSSVNEVELIPLKLVGNEYQVDLISCMGRWCIGSDLNDEVFIWDLDNAGDRLGSFKFDKQASIWALSLINHNFIALGLSDGRLMSCNIEDKSISELKDSNNNGITQILPIGETSRFILTRLSGHIDLVEVLNGVLMLLTSIRAHQTPILNILYKNDSLFTTSKDRTIKIYCLNNELTRLNVIFSEEMSDITCLAVDHLCQQVAYGLENGLVCLQNISNPSIPQKLSIKLKNQVIKLEFTSKLLLSLHLNHKIHLWDYQKVILMKEIQLINNSLDMCLYSESILITNGHESLLLWDLNTCDVIRKINFKHESNIIKIIKLTDKQKAIILNHNTNTLSFMQIPF